MALTNAQLWDYLRGKYPNFANRTAKATKDLFTSRGFEEIQSFDSSILNDYFGLSLRVFLQKISVADVKDLLEGQGFGESYDTPYGGYIQRMSIETLKPVSPAYKGLQNGDAPDQYIVRKPETDERFYTQNFDYQSVVTMPDTDLYKNMWVQENGMSEFMAGVMKALNNGYILQKYNNKLEALNTAINSAIYPLKATQTYQLNVANAESLTDAEIIAFIKLVRDIVDAMVYTPATGAYNEAGFETTQDKNRLKILMRPAFANKLATISKLNSMEDMSLPVDIVKIPDFGGLFATDSDGHALDPIYDALGTITGWAYNGTEVPEPAITWVDPNARIQAIIADKGVIFESNQNPYQVEPARNARGLYTNFWASSVNNAISVDRNYNLVTIEVKQS